MRICPLCSGSGGNSTYVEAGDVRLLIDAGLSCRRICALLASINVHPNTLTAILVTHEHIDHIRGIDVLARTYNIPVYANMACHQAMFTPLCRVPRELIKVFESDAPFVLGKATILPFSTPHDSAHSVGYSITHGDSHFTLMTDIGHMDDNLLANALGSQTVLIEANHDVDMLMAGDYPYPLKRRILSPTGHLCNDDCAQAIVKLIQSGTKTIILGHLSEHNNFEEIALATVNCVLKLEGLSDSATVVVARRFEPTGYFDIA